MFDVFVIGGGPAGLMAALRAAERGLKTHVAEYLPSPGRKLLASGAGKCNLTNILKPGEMAERFLFGERFVRPAFHNLPSEKLRDWFRARHVPTDTEDGFHYFPTSRRAGDVLDALLGALREAHGTIESGAAVRELLIEEGCVAGAVTADGRRFRARHVVLACGGKGYPALGGRGSGYELVRQAGHTIVEPLPALVGLQCSEKWVGTLAGTLLENALVRFDKKSAGEGALIFTHTGVNGPAVLDYSGTVARRLAAGGAVTVELSFFAGRDRVWWLREIGEWRRRCGKRQLKTLLNEHLPQRLCDEIFRLSGDCGSVKASEISGAVRDRLVGNLTGMKLQISGTDGWEKAMATAGGAALQEINAKTMASRILPGLSFCGEIIDIDGPCGGFNLHWAFSSGALCGENVLKGGL